MSLWLKIYENGREEDVFIGGWTVDTLRKHVGGRFEMIVIPDGPYKDSYFVVMNQVDAFRRMESYNPHVSLIANRFLLGPAFLRLNKV